MNRKGFTTVELLLTMILVMIIMSTITSVTYAYRDRSTYEDILTNITNYKNNVTKVIYDDILTTTQDDKIISMSKVSNTNYTFNTSTTNNKYSLIIIDEPNKKGIAYGEASNLVEYIIPGSDEGLIEIEPDNSFYANTATNVYSFELVFHHRTLDKSFSIKFTIS